MKKIIAIVLLASCLLLLCACGREPREVRTAEINKDGELVIIFTDGTSSTVGIVKGDRGDDGKDGADGRDGVDGKDGIDGKDGETGATGQKGPQGASGRSIADVSIGEGGALVVTYSDSTTSSITLLGELYLFGGQCGEKAFWGLYNGGILVISGEGTTYNYTAESPAPWTSVISLISAVVVDNSKLTEGTGLLDGIDEGIITRVESYEISYVDMVAEAPIFDNPELEGEPIKKLPACTEIHIMEQTTEYAKLIFDDSTYGYISAKYLRDMVKDGPGSMIYNAPEGFEYIRPLGEAMNMRSFPDASETSNNIRYTIETKDFQPDGELYGEAGILCTGVSQNGNWYRVAYKGETLYVAKSVVQEVR